MALLKNLSNCGACLSTIFAFCATQRSQKTPVASFKAGIPRDGIAGLLAMLQRKDVYPETKFIYDPSDPRESAKREAAVKLQCTVFEVLHALARLDANKEAIGPKGVRRIVEYITPHSGLLYYVFPWNMEIEQRVLSLLATLLTDAANKNEFVAANGLGLLLNILKLPEVFPENIEALCASIITGPLEKEMRSLEGLDTILISLFKYLPGSVVLQNTLVDTFTVLAASDVGSQRIFEEGGVHVLFKLLVAENNSVRLRALGTVSALSKRKFIRKVMRLLDPQIGTIASCATPLLPDERSHEPLSELLYNLANPDEAKDLLENQAALGAILVLLGSLCVSPSVNARRQSAGTFLKLIGSSKSGAALMLASTSGALSPIFKAMASPDVAVQTDALLMATELCGYENARPALEAADFVARLKEAGRTHAVCKKGSKLVEVVSALVAAWKKAPGENTRRAGFELVLDPGGDGAPLKLPVSPATVELSAIEEHAQTLLGATKRDHVVLSKQLANKPGESVVPRNTEELRQLLAADVKAGLRSATIRVYIKRSSRRTLLIAKPPAAAAASAVATPAALPVELDRLQEADLKRLVVLLCERLKLPVKDAVALLKPPLAAAPRPLRAEVTPMRPPDARAPSPTVPDSVDSSDVFGAMLAELRKKASVGLAFLNHVDASAEQARRAKEIAASNKAGLLRDIVQHPQEHTATRRLISQEVVAGRELWKRSMLTWISEVAECVLGNNGALLRVVVHLCVMPETRCAWDDVTKQLLQPVAPRLAAKQLNRIGFAISQAIYSSAGDDALTTEYLAVLRPQRLPVRQLLRCLEYKIADVL